MLPSFHIFLNLLFYSIPLRYYLLQSNFMYLLLPAMAKEWREATYPPWAHGPGYVVSQDIARTVSRKYRKGHLKVFEPSISRH